MKNALSTLFIALSLVIFFDVVNAGQALMLFLLAGVIPGTNIVISATQMLEMVMLLLGLVVGRLNWHIVAGLGGMLFARRNTLSPQA